MRPSFTSISTSSTRRTFLASSLLFIGALAALPGCKDTSQSAGTEGAGATNGNSVAQSGSQNGVTNAGGAGSSAGTGGQVATPYDASAPEIKIGAYFSLSGDKATFGRGSVKGITMAFEEVNKAGGVLGKPLKLITQDTASKTEQGGSVVKNLIYRENVLAVLGEVASSISKAGAPVCQDAKVPMLSPSSTDVAVTRIGDYIFRTCFIDPFQGKVAAKFGRENLKLKSAAILTDSSSDYSKGLTQVFRDEWKKAGGDIVVEKSYTQGDKDFRSQLTSIKGLNPDVLYVPGYYTEVGNIAVQARSTGMKQLMMGGDGWDSPKLFDVAKAQLQGCYFSNHYSPQSKDKRVVDFIARFKARYNGEIPDALTAVGYDAALVMADAIKRAGALDRAKLRDALARTKDFPGVTGTISMDANRNAIKPAVILKIVGSEGQYVTMVNP